MRKSHQNAAKIALLFPVAISIMYSFAYFETFMADDFHIGNSIKAELKRQDRSIAWLARQVFCDRGNMSRILSNKYIDMQMLRRISLSLNCNFFKELYENMQAELKKAGEDDAQITSK